MTERQRRMFLINAPFQLKYVLLLMGWGAFLALAFAVWNYQSQQHAVELAVHDPMHRDVIVRGGRQMLWALGGLCALSVAALGILGLVMTHRIAGPVFVMNYFLELLAEGRFPPPRALRRHDELKAFHAQFIKAIDAMKAREAEHLEHLDAAMIAMRQALPRAPELSPALRVLEADAGQRRVALEEASPKDAAAPLRAVS